MVLSVRYRIQFGSGRLDFWALARMRLVFSDLFDGISPTRFEEKIVRRDAFGRTQTTALQNFAAHNGREETRIPTPEGNFLKFSWARRSRAVDPAIFIRVFFRGEIKR